MMLEILTFSDELVSEVPSHLPRRDLYNLSFLSRRMSDLVFPLLFQRIIVLVGARRTDHRSVKSTSFIRSLRENPFLGKWYACCT
jgi:hypothetical protein